MAVRMEGGVSPTSSMLKHEHHGHWNSCAPPARVCDEKGLIVSNQFQGTWRIDVFGVVDNGCFGNNGPEWRSVIHLTRVCPPPSDPTVDERLASMVVLYTQMKLESIMPEERRASLDQRWGGHGVE